MRPLQLDYQRSHAPSRLGGIVLLAIAVALSFKLFSGYSALSDQAAVAEDKLARLERLSGRAHPDAGHDSADSASLRQEMNHANEVLRHLSLPWDKLFKAVESSATDQVALLSIQPDEKRGTVSIGGEAKNVEAMLDYVRRLQRSHTLSNIYLVNHQVEQQDPQTPVRFSVVATWLNK